MSSTNQSSQNGYLYINLEKRGLSYKKFNREAKRPQSKTGDETHESPSIASPADSRYPHHPFIKMPGQNGSGNSSSTSSSTRRDTSTQDTPSHSHTPGHSILKMPKQSGIQSAAKPETSKEDVEPLSLDEWEEISDNTDGLLDHNTSYVIDCFIAVQGSMRELERAIQKTSHRREFMAGIEAANEGLDCLNINLDQVIKGLLEES